MWTAKAVRRYFEDRLGEAGGSLSTWGVLSALELFHWRTQHELARALQIEGATLTRHLDRLESAGLVSRRRGGGDRRAIQVEATPAGREAYERMLGAAMSADRKIRSVLSEEELATLHELLSRIRGALEPAGEAAGDAEQIA